MAGGRDGRIERRDLARESTKWRKALLGCDLWGAGGGGGGGVGRDAMNWGWDPGMEEVVAIGRNLVRGGARVPEKLRLMVGGTTHVVFRPINSRCLLLLLPNHEQLGHQAMLNHTPSRETAIIHVDDLNHFDVSTPKTVGFRKRISTDYEPEERDRERQRELGVLRVPLMRLIEVAGPYGIRQWSHSLLPITRRVDFG